MPAENGSPSDNVYVTKLIPAARPDVFEAWLDPDLRRRWWRPGGPGTECVQVEIKAQVGGEFRTLATGPGKSRGCNNFGRFVEIVRPERLVFTWSSADPEDHVADTLVTVEFHARGRATLVVVTHARLPQPQRDAHEDGWTRLLDYLREALAEN